MNIKRAKEEIEHTVKAYLAKDALGEYAIPAIRQRPILLMGPPGIGKTQVMELDGCIASLDEHGERYGFGQDGDVGLRFGWQLAILLALASLQGSILLLLGSHFSVALDERFHQGTHDVSGKRFSARLLALYDDLQHDGRFFSLIIIHILYSDTCKINAEHGSSHHQRRILEVRRRSDHPFSDARRIILIGNQVMHGHLFILFSLFSQLFSYQPR